MLTPSKLSIFLATAFVFLGFLDHACAKSPYAPFKGIYVCGGGTSSSDRTDTYSFVGVRLYVSKSGKVSGKFSATRFDDGQARPKKEVVFAGKLIGGVKEKNGNRTVRVQVRLSGGGEAVGEIFLAGKDLLVVRVLQLTVKYKGTRGVIEGTAI